jgi:hypothetical protein
MTDDELIASTFDEVKTTTVQMVNGRPRISDEAQIAEIDMQEACEAFVAAEQKFNKIAAHKMDANFDVCAWWDALEERYQCEKRVWTMFIQGDRSRRTGLMYLQFREALFAGKKLRGDA